MRRLSMRLLATGTALALVLAACGGGGGGGKKSGGQNGTKSNLPACPVHALDNVTKPVTITLWHSMVRANLDTLNKLVTQFNSSQQKVRVKLVAQTSYTDTLTKFKAGLGNKELPDIVQGEDVALQELIDTQEVLPAQSCINAEHYDLSDFVPRMVKYYTVENVLYPMPFNTSNPILYYDKSAFRAAGLDPNKPPTTLDEVKADAQAIVSKHVEKFGIALHTDSWFLEQWLAQAGSTFVNNGNGRAKRATATTFNDPAGLNIFTWLSDMVKSKLMLSTGAATGSIDHYLAVANQQAAMTIDTSAALGTISQILGSGQFKNVELGVGQLPGPSGNGGPIVGGGALFMVRASSAEKQAAAWQFLKFLDTPQSQSTWAAGTGYVPVRKSATTRDPLKTRWAQQPYYRVAYDQLASGPNNDATAGPVIGPYGGYGVGVRGAVIDAVQSMYQRSVAPKTALASAAKNADAVMTSYNQRIGAG